MATKYIWISGPAKWFHIYPATMDTKFGKVYSLDLYLDNVAMNTLKEAGWRGKTKVDELGTFAKFSRKHEQQFNSGLETLGPPKVVDTNGADFDKPLGNGTTVNVLLELYDSRYGKGSRIREVVIKDYVEYVKKEGGSLPPV